MEGEAREGHVVESLRIPCKQKDAYTVAGGLGGTPDKVGGRPLQPLSRLLSPA